MGESKSNMINKLRKLDAHMMAYRTNVDRIFSAPPGEPRACRKYFFELLRDLSQIYAASLVLLDEFSNAHVPGMRTGGKLLDIDAKRFGELRKRFRDQLQSLPCWASFEPRFAFSEATGLSSVEDYLNSLTLHLPEIYEETLRAKDYADSLLREPTDSAVAGITTGLEHMSYNHISFVFAALQRAASETAWLDEEMMSV